MIKLNVPFNEKDDAKKLGAMWDQESKSWYIPNKHYGKIIHFQKWIDFELSDDFYVLSAPIYFIQTTMKCFHCGEIINIYGLCNNLKNRIYSFSIDLDDEEVVGYESSKKDYYYKKFGFHVRFISYVNSISKSDRSKLYNITDSIKFNYCRTIGHSYYANVCNHCKMAQDDFELYQEPDEGFLIDFSDKVVNMNVFNEKYDLLFSGVPVEWTTL